MGCKHADEHRRAGNSITDANACAYCHANVYADTKSDGHSNGNNIYTIKVRASDGRLTTSVNVTVTVTNVNERPSVASAIADQTMTAGDSTTVSLPGRFSDPDGDTLAYTAAASPSGIATASVSNSDIALTLRALAAGSATITVTAADRSLGHADRLTVSQDFTVTVEETNVPPTFNEGPRTTRSVAENTPSSNDIGSPVTASDDDNDTLSYSLSGTDAGSFRIGRISGQIRTFDSLNFETKNSYSVTVTADDGNGGTDSIDVTINVTDVNERPTVASAIGNRTITVGDSTPISLLRWFNDPDGDTLTYSASTSPSGIATAGVSGSTLTLTALSVGSATITVTAADRPQGDADRLTAEQIFTVTVEASTPAKVTGLQGEPGTNHREIDLNWDAADEASRYQVGQKESGTDDWIVLPADGFGVAINGTAAVVSNLDPDKTYDYQVRGTNVHGEGEWSDAITEITVGDERPDKPEGLMVDEDNMIGGRGIPLKWQAVAGARGYMVETTPAASSHKAAVIGESGFVTGLTPGTNYTFRVRACNPCRVSPLYSLPSDSVQKAAPEPTNIGHQEDHTVAYEMGPVTSAPNLPDGVPDAATVISAAIEPAAAAWNPATATGIPGKDLKICEDGDGDCDNRNHDGFTATIRTASQNTMETTGYGNVFRWDEGCGRSVACVKDPLAFPGFHRGNMAVILEEPAWDCSGGDINMGTCDQHVRIYWTGEPGLHGEPVDDTPLGIPSSYYYYIGLVMIHEFGHTLGLPDFGTDPTLAGLPAIMSDPHTYRAITTEDLEQLRAIYLLHDSASH